MYKVKRIADETNKKQQSAGKQGLDQRGDDRQRK
jgi:hypothetical protein